MTSKSAFEISSDQKVHLVSAANKIGKFSWPAVNNRENNDTLPEISVDKSVEHGGVPVNNSEENNFTLLDISVPVNNRENNDTLPEISVDKNNDTLPDIEETGEVSTATNTVNNKQIDPKSMKVKELKLQLRKLGLSTTGNKPILVDRLTSGLKKKTVGQNYIF